MEKNIEVEMRGRIDEAGFRKLAEFFSREGMFKQDRKRLLIDYSTFLPEEGIENRQRDIRLRITNDVPEIIVKLGGWGADEARKELSMLAQPGEFEKLVQIFAALGLTKGMLCVRNSKIFEYQGIEFALVEVPGHSYYFEAEAMAGSDDEISEAKNRIRNLCAELGMGLFQSDQAFYDYINLLNKEANLVFDFRDFKEGFFDKYLK